MAFYQALTTGYSGENRKITGGCSLAMAFAQAEGLSKAARGGKPRDLVAETPAHEDVTDDDGFPWIVQYRKGSEHVGAGTSSKTIPCSACPACPPTSAGPSSRIATWSTFSAITPGSSSAAVGRSASCTTCSPFRPNRPSPGSSSITARPAWGRPRCWRRACCRGWRRCSRPAIAADPLRTGCWARYGTRWLPAPSRSISGRPGWKSRTRPSARS